MGLPDRVAHIYYSHGLFCSSHPILTLSLAFSLLFVSCYPLLYSPLAGDMPLQMTSSTIQPGNRSEFSGQPAFYIQQVVVRSGISPWSDQLLVQDAFRAPLAKIFSILETIRNHQVENSSHIVTISDICLHVDEVKLKSNEERRKFLPEYGCLILSHANFWMQDENLFQSDSNLLSTIFNHHSYQKGKISLSEILFGINMKETGLKRNPLRSRARTIQYAITMVFNSYHSEFIDSLRHKLEAQYQLYVSTNAQPPEILHIFYPDELNLYGLLPLVLVFFTLFIYVYFSLRKIELISAKALTALSVCFTIVSCLLMTIGLCFFFGLTVSVSSKELFPYLVVVVGLENVLVITKSVTSTPAHLDAKIRVAQGLSKEGWSMTKLLLIQVTILTVGLCTFVSTVQELCILGLVGLVCDFFLQLFLFTTILSIDIHRSERQGRNQSQSRIKFRFTATVPENSRMGRSASQHNLTSYAFKPSRRLILVDLWAKTRFVQRILMVSLIMWIISIFYSSGLIQAALGIDEIARFHDKLQDQNNQENPLLLESVQNLKTLTDFIRPSGLNGNNKHSETEHEEEETNMRLRHRELDPHRRLSVYHWPVMFSLYNLSLTYKYLTVLPSIRLSIAVSPQEALVMRNPKEQLHWSTLAVALDPLDISPPVGSNGSHWLLSSFDRVYFPRSPMEIALTFVLISVSVVVLAYMTVVLYRCICSRNYAEWRSSWQQEQSQTDNQIVLESVAMSLDGHPHEIECLATDHYQIVSTDLSGQVRVWNAYDGELICQIDRGLQREKQVSNEDLNHSDYDSGSPPSNGDSLGDNIKRLNVYGDNVKRATPIWCLDVLHEVVALGCCDGSIEFWHANKGQVQCIFEDGSDVGVTSLRILEHRVIAARLNGTVDFLKLEKGVDPHFELQNNHPIPPWGLATVRRNHVRAASAGSILDWRDTFGELRCIKLNSVRAHQQPITVLDCDSCRIVTGSQDHTLKVLRVEDAALLYTLHGHCGPISCMFIDCLTPYLAGSGSQDGLLCVWDLLTGACMFNIQAHDGSITALTYSSSYIISLGTDDKLCIWERFLGHLLNTISVVQTYCNSMVMVTHHLLLTSRHGSLVLWDVRLGEPVRIVRLGHTDQGVFVKQILRAGDSFVCDYASQLRVIRFPIVADKTD